MKAIGCARTEQPDLRQGEGNVGQPDADAICRDPESINETEVKEEVLG
jgi:hypothetical protein